MSKEFLKRPTDVFSHSANDYEKLTRFTEAFIHYTPDGKPHKFGYCTFCTLKVFWCQPNKDKKDHYFRHVGGIYTPSERIRMLSCSNYKPSKGVAGSPEPLPKAYLDDIFLFLKENAFWIYKFINAMILKDIGRMSMDFFIKIIEELFVTNVDNLTTADKIIERTLPFRLLVLMYQKKGNIYYRDIRNQTINFDDLKKNLKDKFGITYFDFIHFSLRDEFEDNECMGIEIMKNSSGSDLPQCLHLIKIPMNGNLLLNYIQKKKDNEKNFLLSDDEIMRRFPSHNNTYVIADKNKYIKIKNAMETFFP